MKKTFLILSFILLNSAALFAQLEKPVIWAYKAKKINNKEAELSIKATIQDKWHIYSLNVKSLPLATKLTFASSKDYTLIGKPVEPKPISIYDHTLKANLTYFEHEVVFKQKIKLNKNQTIVKGTVEFIACNDKSCLPADEISFSIPIK